MKKIALATALAAVVRVAHAQTTASPQSPDDTTLRAENEARAMIATMQSCARLARLALEHARERHDSVEMRCADEALSRADVALRAGRDEAGLLAVQGARHDAHAASATLERLRLRRAAASEAAAIGVSCSARKSVGPGDHTTVSVVAIEPGKPR